MNRTKLNQTEPHRPNLFNFIRFMFLSPVRFGSVLKTIQKNQTEPIDAQPQPVYMHIITKIQCKLYKGKSVISPSAGIYWTTLNKKQHLRCIKFVTSSSEKPMLNFTSNSCNYTYHNNMYHNNMWEETQIWDSVIELVEFIFEFGLQLLPLQLESRRDESRLRRPRIGQQRDLLGGFKLVEPRGFCRLHNLYTRAHELILARIATAVLKTIECFFCLELAIQLIVREPVCVRVEMSSRSIFCLIKELISVRNLNEPHISWEQLARVWLDIAEINK